MSLQRRKDLEGRVGIALQGTAAQVVLLLLLLLFRVLVVVQVLFDLVIEVPVVVVDDAFEIVCSHFPVDLVLYAL